MITIIVLISVTTDTQFVMRFRKWTQFGKLVPVHHNPFMIIGVKYSIFKINLKEF